MYPASFQEPGLGMRWTFDRLSAYAAALTAAAAGLVGLAFAAGMPLSERAAWPVILFALVAIAVERESIQASARAHVSVAFLPLVFVEVVFGPLTAAGVAF